MQAIITKYIAPTNTKGSRISAKCDAKRIVVEWEYSLGVEDNHALAAAKLRDQLGWNTANYGRIVSGGLPNQGGYVHVMTGVQS